MTVSPVSPSLHNICRRLKNNDTALTHLDCTGLNIGDHGVTALSAALSDNKQLKSLSLSYNLISQRGAVRLFEDDGISNIEHLDLRFNSIGNEGAQALARRLQPSAAKQKNQTLTQLSLRNNYVGPHGGVPLILAMKDNTTLQHVDLGSNGLGNTGAVAIRQLLETNTHLKSLCLWSNEMDDDGIREITEGLRHNRTLETLNLGGNRIGNHGAMHLATMLQHNTTLKQLHLANSHIGAQGALALASVLRTNKTMQVLELLHNPIGIEAATLFCFHLKHSNRTLRELRLDYYQPSATVATTTTTVADGRECINAQILLYLKLNQLGRQHMTNVNLPWSAWPKILEKVSVQADLLFLVLNEKPELMMMMQMEVCQ